MMVRSGRSRSSDLGVQHHRNAHLWLQPAASGEGDEHDHEEAGVYRQPADCHHRPVPVRHPRKDQRGEQGKGADLRPASRMVALREDTSEPQLCGNCAGTPSKRRRSLPTGGLGDARVSAAFIGRSRLQSGRGLAWAHNPKDGGSNPPPATRETKGLRFEP